MTKTLITYRTPDYGFNQYCCVPDIWLSAMISWLTGSQVSDVVAVRKNVDHPISVPVSWPHYKACLEYTHSVSLVEA